MPVDEETLPITLRFGSKLTSDLKYMGHPSLGSLHLEWVPPVRFSKKF